jgi:hypothetical protein
MCNVCAHIIIISYNIYMQAYEGLFERNKSKYAARKEGNNSTSDEEIVLNIH